MASNNNESKWREMKQAEWRGEAGAKLEHLESLVTAISAKVDTHAEILAVLKDRGARAQLGGKARAIIVSAVVASAGSIVVALIALLH